MIGLTEAEMMDGSIDYIAHRYKGWAMLNKHKEKTDFINARLISFVIAKVNGAKCRTPEDFMPLNETKKSKLDPEWIKKHKNNL